MNFKEEKDLKKVEEKLASYIRNIRTDIKPERASLTILLAQIDINKDGQSSVSANSVDRKTFLNEMFISNRNVFSRSFLGIGFVTVLLVALIVSVIDLDVTKGDIGSQISSLEADIKMIEKDFDKKYDEEITNEELDINNSALKDSLPQSGLQ